MKENFLNFLLLASIVLIAFNFGFPFLPKGKAESFLLKDPRVLSGSAQSSYPKELYIPLGKGSVSNMNWVELGGVEAVIDMDRYPDVESVIFEASMRIPTANGKAYAKLYNVTEKHDAWFSEVWAEGSEGYRAESGKVILSPGRKLYRVKMKSTMGYEAILDLARLKILLR